MSENTKIEWCDHTFNPWEGCTKVSPGCANCYAEARDRRFGGGHWGAGAHRRRTSEANWKEPLKWDRWCRNNGVRKKVFALSIGDWLDDRVPIEWLADFLYLICMTPNLDWLLLTKRPENWRLRMSEVVGFLKSLGYEEENKRYPGLWSFLFSNWLDGFRPPNIWIGTTVEDQTRADERIPELLWIPARVRFLSCEPLLGPVDLSGARLVHLATPFAHPGMHQTPLIDWVIAGGESGPQARPMHPDWARSLRDQCEDAGVPFFFKQWGEWVPAGQLPTVAPADHPLFQGKVEFRDGHYRIGKKHAGRKLDGREHNEFPGHAG